MKDCGNPHLPGCAAQAARPSLPIKDRAPKSPVGENSKFQFFLDNDKRNSNSVMQGRQEEMMQGMVLIPPRQEVGFYASDRMLTSEECGRAILLEKS